MGDEMRAFWLSGINRVTGKPRQTLVGLLGSQQYQMFVPVRPASIELHFASWDLVAGAFAADSAQAAMASIESIEAARSVKAGESWAIIKAYYAGFFAANSIQRMLGRAVVQVDGPVATAIDQVAGVYGMAGKSPVERGLYVIRADATSKVVCLSKWRANGGSHVCLWTEMVGLLREVTNGLLSSKRAVVSTAHVVNKLIEVERTLTDRGNIPRGSWLSVIRNRVNYQQEFGIWYPYAGRASYCDSLVGKIGGWRSDPDRVSIWPGQDRELQRFLEACVFLVALCRTMSIDMNSRCPAGRSFQHYTTMPLLRQLGIG